MLKYKYNIVVICLLTSIIRPVFAGSTVSDEKIVISFSSHNDPQLDRQLLYNGRIWRDLYSKVKGDEFLFSSEFLQGNIEINGKTFNNIRMKYDIYNDEIICPVTPVLMVQLNKEKVREFEIYFENRRYKFININDENNNVLQGYVNILYQYNTALCLKYIKGITALAVDNKYDKFSQIQILYLFKDGLYNRITGKRDFFRHLRDKNIQIRDFIKQNKIKVTKKRPESFIPVLEFYDNLNE